MADTPITTNTPYKPGGTGHLIQGELLGRVTNHEKDRLGRWTITNLIGRDKKVAIYAIYQSSISTTQHSNITFHTQQRIIFEKEKTNPDEIINDKTPRKRFRKDLLKQIESKLKDEYEIVLLGDFNESKDQNASIIQEILELGFKDVWKEHHPDQEELVTYNRGSKRIDFCLATSGASRAIQQIYYTNFQEISFSDHRGIVVDIDHKVLFTNKNITEYHERQLFSNDRRQVSTYLEKMHDHLVENRAYEIRDALLKTDIFQPEKLERLDNIVTDASIAAEKTLKTRRRPWWSSRLNKARYKLRLLRNHHRRIKQGFVSSPDIQFRLDNNAFNIQLPKTLSQSSALLQESKDELTEVIKKAKAHREEEQLERFDYLNRTGQKDAATVVKAIRHKERLAEAYRQIKSLRHPLQDQAINRVDVPKQWVEQDKLTIDNMEDPKDTTEWVTITEPAQIEKFMIIRNKKHFNQAEGTPLTANSWRDMLNWAGTSDTARQITAGQFGMVGLEETHAAVLSACKSSLKGSLTDFRLTNETFRARIRHWRESTATSPSGRHLGHYRALVTSLSNVPDKTVREKLQNIQENVSQLLVDIINYTVLHRYSLKRWHRIESTMIPKDRNSFKIHRMRVIHIFEADYNLLLGLKWRETILALENTTILHPDQHGSRPGRSATVLPLQEELCYDISRCSRTNLCNFDNDATACYDRVVAELASLAGKKHGVHEHLIAVNTRTLAEAKYFIRSKVNKNKEYYQHTPEFPIHGTGQGCANSPTVWCTVSSVLFEAHNQVSNGCSFQSPDLTIGTKFTMVGFVDDSTGRVNDFTARPQPDSFKLTATITEDAQNWHDILWFSGGKLELAKCSYHFVSWEFRESGEPKLIEHQNLPQIALRTPDDQVIRIQRKSVFSPHKTLGHFKAPNSKLVVQLQKLKEKASQIANAIYQSSIPQDLVWTLYNSIYLSSVGYVLPQSNFETKKLEAAQKKSMSQIIAKCGYNRKSRSEVMYGPTYLGGAGFIPWETLQGEGQILNFLQHWRGTTKTSNLLKVSLAWAQYQAGTESSILEDVDRPLHYVEAKWVISMRRFLCKMEGQLELDKTHCYPSQRTNDRHLMDIAYVSGAFTTKELKRLNYCRLYLRVTTVSDIVNIQGNKFQDGAFTGQRELLHSTPRELQAIQEHPHYKSWCCWVRLMRMIGKQDGALHQPLGRWLLPGSRLKRIWRSYYNPDTCTYHVKGAEGKWFKRYQQDGEWMQTTLRSWRPSVNDVPKELHTTLHFHPLQWQDIRQQSFQDFLLDNDFQQIFDYIQLYSDPYDIAHKMATSLETLVVSDGSSKNKRMSQGWVVATVEHGKLAEGAGPGFGTASSHRAESYGVCAASLFVQLLQQYTKTELTDCTFQCDNSGLIQTLQTNQEYSQIFPNQYLRPDRDQIDHILHNIHNLQDAEFDHVKGHQDENNKELDMAAEMNVRADALAGWYDQQHPKRRFRASVTRHSGVQLHIRNKTVTSNYRQHIRNAIHGPAFRQHLCEQNQWGDDEATNIDWSQYATLNHSVRHLRVWKTKFINDLLPTVRRDATWSYNRPACNHCSTVDTWQHTLCCPLDSRRKPIKQFLRRLATHLEEQDTDPELQEGILNGLKSWFFDKPIEAVFQHPVQAEQECIGWYAFLKGFWHFHWAREQQNYLQRKGHASLSHNGRNWMHQTQVFILTAMHQLWTDFTGSVHRPEAGQSAMHFRLTNKIQQLQDDHSQLCP